MVLNAPSDIVTPSTVRCSWIEREKDVLINYNFDVMLVQFVISTVMVDDFDKGKASKEDIFKAYDEEAPKSR